MKKNPRFNVGDRVKISKCKNILAKGYTQNWSEEVFTFSEIKNTVQWTYVISGLKLLEVFMKKNFKKKNNEKDDSFNSWINKKDLIE